MSTHGLFHHDRVASDDVARNDAVERTEVRSRDSSAINLVARLVALVAAAVPTIIGLIALARLDWNNGGIDAPAVSVADMTFRPWIAIATVAAGVIALIAAAMWDRESKLVVGTLLACGGVAILLANPTVQQITLSDRMGWMWVVVGGVLIVAGLLAGQRFATTRRVERTPVA